LHTRNTFLAAKAVSTFCIHFKFRRGL